MALYDMQCDNCNTTLEVRCAIAERENQKCATCSAPLTPLFSPPTTVVIPNAFKVVFSDLFGTSSEKDFLKENPGLERPASKSQHSEREKKAAERSRIIREGQDIEKALIAQGKLKRYDVEAGSTESDV